MDPDGGWRGHVTSIVGPGHGPPSRPAAVDRRRGRGPPAAVGPVPAAPADVGAVAVVPARRARGPQPRRPDAPRDSCGPMGRGRRPLRRDGTGVRGVRVRPAAVLHRPALADVNEPATARFVDAFAEATALITEAYPGPQAGERFVAAAERQTGRGRRRSTRRTGCGRRASRPASGRCWSRRCPCSRWRGRVHTRPSAVARTNAPAADWRTWSAAPGGRCRVRQANCSPGRPAASSQPRDRRAVEGRTDRFPPLSRCAADPLSC